MKRIFLILIFGFLAHAAHAEGYSFIRDSEIENCVREIANPIFKTAGLVPNNVQIYLINDSELNAFVAEGMNIFINTGLLTYSDDPLVLTGVIAHESGHMAGGHLIRRQEEMENASYSTILGYLLGAAAIAGGSASAGQAIMMGTGEVTNRSMLKYSRTQEESADHAGLKFLNNLKLSAKGMLNLLQYLNSQENLFYDKANPYLLTHPLSKERIVNVENAVDNSPYSGNDQTPAIKTCYKRSVAKLKAFLNDPRSTMDEYPASDRSIPARYARAIAYYKIPELEKSLAEIDSLIKENPSDPYFYELKGQVLFENGRVKESVTAYEKAEKLLPSSALIKVGLGNSLLATNDKEAANKAVKYLEQAVRMEPKEGLSWRQLATAYGQVGKIAESNLALAEEAMLKGQKQDAARFAEIAKDGLPVGTPSYIRASDIAAVAGKKNKGSKH